MFTKTITNHTYWSQARRSTFSVYCVLPFNDASKALDWYDRIY